MSKFTDSPYFLIDGYLKDINIKPDDDIKSKIISLWPILYTDWTNSNYEDTNYSIWNFDYETIEGSYSNKIVNYTYENSYLLGQNKTIIVSGGRLLELFVKEDDFGFRKIDVTPPYDNFEDGNFFNFIKHPDLFYQYGSTLSEIVSGDRYYFEIWEPTFEFDSNEINDKEVYFRKDSQFHKWLIGNAKDYFINLWGEEFVIRNYVNTDKQFLYFGKIYYQHDNMYHIEFYGMKDFTLNAIPYHQRTPKIKKYFEVEFDRVYQEVYNLLKNIWTLNDPYEIDKKFLDYTANFYDLKTDFYPMNVLNQREFIREMTYFLKRKGSYSSFYDILKILTPGTFNPLNIFEKWLNRNNVDYINGDVSDNDFIELDYTERYNTNTFPLSGNNPNDFILSPYCKLQLNMTDSPIYYDAILPQKVITDLIYEWEKLRPVNKVIEYKINFYPEIYLDDKRYYLYENRPLKYETNFKTYLENFVFSDIDAFIQVFGNISEVPIEHNLNSKYVFVQCYDYNFKPIIPIKIHFINENNLKLYFDTNIIGFALIKKPMMTINQNTVLTDEWKIKHYFLTKDVYLAFSQLDDKTYTNEVTLLNNKFFETDLTYGNVIIRKPDYVHTQNSLSDTWIINHNLHFKGVLINIFDNDTNKIKPKSINFIDSDNCEITFYNPVKGVATILGVGNPLFAEMLFEEIQVNGQTEILLPYYEISSIQDDFQTYDLKERVSSYINTPDALYLIINLPFNQEFTIKEIKIYNYDNSISIYSECGEIYKPMNVQMQLKYKINKFLPLGGF